MCISFLVLQICGGYLGSSGSSEKCFRFKNSVWEKYTSTKEKRYLAAAVMHNDKLHMYGTFHEQHSIGYGFPSLLLVTRASADVSELVFKHEWRSHECLKTIPTHPLRHTWPEVVMGNHTRSSAVHGKAFHKGLTKQSIIGTKVPILKEVNFGKVKLWDVEHFWTLFVFTFGRDCYCIQQSRPKMKTKSVQKCSTSQSFTLPKWHSFKIGTLVSFQTKKIWENETCFHYLSEMWQLLHSCGHPYLQLVEKFYLLFSSRTCLGLRPELHL